MSHRLVIYASTGWGVHDQRWVAALEACGFAVRVLRASPHLRIEVHDTLPSDAPVLAGPLPTVARELIGLPRRVVGLSWGFDLQQGHSQSQERAELEWLTQLDALIVDSPSTAAIAKSVGVRTEDIHLLPWGIDLDAFTPDGPAFEHSLPDDAVIVVSLRTHDDIYRTTDVIEAFALAAAAEPRLHLIMGGAGPLTSQHKARTHELALDDRVLFPGAVPEDGVASLLRAADLYVTASETDGTSVTLLQAMACRVPVVASDIPGNRWWIEDGRSGRLFDVGDVEGLARRMTFSADATQHVQRAWESVNSRADWKRNRLALRDIMNGPPAHEVSAP